MMLREEFEHLVNYQYNEEEKIVLGELTQYIEAKYGIQLYKILYNYYFVKYGRKMSKISRMDIYTYWTRDYRHRVDRKPVNIGGRMRQYVDEENKAREIVERHGLQRYFHPDDLFVTFHSFEQEALSYCYDSSFEEFRKFREVHFNPDTMEEIYPGALFVIYKSRKLMEEAKRNGDQDRLCDAYYRFIKPYDTYNLITRDHHLLTHFDYAGHARTPLEYYDLYLEMLGAE